MIRSPTSAAEYSFSHLAVLERFGQSFESLRVNSIAGRVRGSEQQARPTSRRAAREFHDGRVPTRWKCSFGLPHIRVCSEIRLRANHRFAG